MATFTEFAFEVTPLGTLARGRLRNNLSLLGKQKRTGCMLEPSGKTPTVALSREVTGAGVEVLVLAEEAFEDAYEV